MIWTKQGISRKGTIRRSAFRILTLGLAVLAADVFDCGADPVTLKNSTATFSQSGGWNVSLVTDGTTNDSAGWAVYDFSDGGVGPETAVFETDSDVGFASGSALTFVLHHVNHNPQHGLGRFRLSYTTDARNTFADGLNSGGDVTANWTVLSPEAATATGGATLTILEDGSVLAGGENPVKSVYTVLAKTSAQGITGFRLEALEDSSLPSSGPGRSANGNFVLTEMTVGVDASPSGECVPAFTGMVAWWPFEGSASDRISGASLGLSGGPAYGSGEVGQGLRFDGTNDEGIVPVSQSLNVGAGDGFSIETWVNPSNVTMQPLVEWGAGPQIGGAHFWIGVYGSGSLFANLVDTGGTSHSWRSDVNLVVPNVNQHVGMTYHKASGILRFYVNGAKVTEYLLGSFTPQTTYPVGIGFRPQQEHYSGIIDELSIYDRVLGDAEFSAIFTAGAAGKCASTNPPPTGLVANGSFELGIEPGVQIDAPNSNAITGWSVVAGNIDYVGPSLWVAGDGMRCLDLSGASAGTISQNISGLMEGQRYELSFLMAVNPDAPPPSTELLVTVCGISNRFSMSTAGTRSNLGWREQRLEFTALNAETVLLFASLNPGWAGPVLDRVAVNVSTNPPPPPPSGLVANGSFELGVDPGVSATLPSPDSASITSWMVESGSVDYIGSRWTAGDGSRCIDLSGIAAGTIRQMISDLTPGQAYRLSFLMAGNPEGSPSLKRLRASIGSASEEYSFDTSGFGTGNMGWTEKSLDFTASSSSSLLSFASLTDGIYGPALDKVSILALTNAPPPQGVVVNGSFELGVDPGVGVQINSPDSSAITGWRVQSGNLDYMGTGWIAGDGNRSLDLSGTTAGTISQVISGLTPGQTYRLSFLMAGNPGLIPALPAIKRLRASVGPDSQNYSFDATGFNFANMGWAERTLDFTANESSLTLSFTSLTDGLGGPALDNVAIQAVDSLPPTNCPVPAGLVSWWRAEGDANDSVGNNHGQLRNGAGFAPGMVGQGFLLDGIDDYVLVPDSSTLDLTNEITVELWFKSTEWAAGDTLIDKRTFNDVNYGAIFSQDRGLSVYFGDRVQGWYASEYSPLPSVGVFHHFAGTFAQVDSEHVALKTYLDGALVKEQTFPGNLANSVNNAPVSIGTERDGAADFFKGIIDEVSIYKRALSGTEIATIFHAGSAGKCVMPSAPNIFAGPRSQTVTRGSTVAFSVGASGTAPLAYQWLFNDAPIDGANAPTLTLGGVQLNQSGNYSVTVSNAFGTATSDHAVLVVNPPPATVRVVNANGAGAAEMSVPVELVANGTENALGFSLNFNASVLGFVGASLGVGAPSDAALLVNTNDVAVGRLGLVVGLPADEVFAEGTQRVALVTFLVAPILNQTTVPVSFGDQPTLRQLSDAHAQELPVAFLGGTVSIADSQFEGDVAPRPNGNRSVATIDWVQMGRFVARLDTISSPNEFQRADCAPRTTKGNGLLTVSDWVQAGRYAVGLDPLTVLGGPTEPDAGSGGAGFAAAAVSGRQLGLVSASIAYGQTNVVPVTLECQGNENAASFSIAFDPAKLAFVSAVPGAGSAGGLLNFNTSEAAQGRLGVALAAQPGRTFAAGTREILELRFAALVSAPATVAISFGNAPVPREVSDAAANPLPTDYTAGAVIVTPPPGPPLRITRSGNSLFITWPSSATGFELEATEGALGTAWSVVAGVIELGEQKLAIVPIGGHERYLRLKKP